MEGNKIWFSDLMPERCPVTFHGLVKMLEKYGVEYGLLKGTKDIWCRDYMPVPSMGTCDVFGYRPDYLMDTKAHRETICDNMEVCMTNGIDVVRDCRDVVVDGGNVIRCGDKVVMTAKVLEENPSWTPRALLERLERLLGAQVVLVPWDVEEYYGHADGLVRYLGNGTVLMTNYSQIDRDMAARIRSVLKEHFNVEELRYDVHRPYKNNWAYINWLQTDDVLILPKFEVPEDEQAFHQISRLMPRYEGRIEMVDAGDLVIHEGCLNCCSWTEHDVRF